MLQTLQKAAPNAEFILWGPEDTALARIHASDESVDPSEIENMIVTQALLIQDLAEAGRLVTEGGAGEQAMNAAVVNPPVWIELPAIIAGALAGALFAQKRGLDVIGILALAIVSGLGGGMLRDVLLARIPLRSEEPRYLVAVAGRRSCWVRSSRRRRTGCSC